MPDQDFVRSLGPAFLAHRMRRASELLVEGYTGFLHENGFAAPARSISTLLLLKEHGPLGITEIAHRLRLTHPLIIKLADGLAAAGYVSEHSDPADNRRRLLALTDAGLVQTERLGELLAVMERTFGQISEEIGIDLFAAIERLEAAAPAPQQDRA
jgi:DNA-binding MarR family transcriptional regulator